MIIYKSPISVLTRNDKPNENWTGETDVFVVDDNSELGQKIFQHAPFFEFVLEDGELVDVTPTERPIEPVPEPQPTEIELLQEQVRDQEQAIADLTMYISTLHS